MNKTSQRPKMPKILLYGSFDDLFLEGLSVLKYDFKLSNLSNLKSLRGDFDIVVFGVDCNYQKIKRVLCEVEAVPVVMSGVKELTEFNPQKEVGDCFKYKKKTGFHQLEAIIKATECYKYPYDWNNVSVASKDTMKYLA